MRREASEVIKIPSRPISQITAEAIQAIDKALSQLTEWGVAVPTGSRLHQARALLMAASGAPTVPLHFQGPALGLHALEVAYDFRDIASALPSYRVASVRKELLTALGGKLDPDPEDRQPLQFQSQYLVIAALHRSGVELEYPTHSPRKGVPSPEVIAINGIARYAVEVKRPQSAKRVPDRLHDAAEQIDGFGLEGAILVDLTDVVRHVPPEEFNATVRTEALKIYSTIWQNGVGPRPGYAKVFVGGGFARRAWYLNQGPPPIVKIDSHSSIARFAMVPKTLRDHHGGWLRGKFHEGMALLGFSGDGAPLPPHQKS